MMDNVKLIKKPGGMYRVELGGKVIGEVHCFGGWHAIVTSGTGHRSVGGLDGYKTRKKAVEALVKLVQQGD